MMLQKHNHLSVRG